MIADDLAVDVKTAALLSSAFTLPYALVQPALGVTGDFFGKTRLMSLCLLVVALSALVCAVAMSFSLLLAIASRRGWWRAGYFRWRWLSPAISSRSNTAKWPSAGCLP